MKTLPFRISERSERGRAAGRGLAAVTIALATFALPVRGFA